MKLAFRRIAFCMMTAALVAGLARHARAQAMIVSGKSLDALFEDAEFILREAAPEEFREQGLAMLQQVRAPESFAGIDRTRPFGAWVTLPATREAPPVVAAAVPITALNQALETLKGFGLAVEAAEVEGFTHKIALPDGNTNLFVAATKEYAFLSIVPANADALKAMKPADWMPRHGDAGDISMTMRFDKLPEWFKTTMLEGMEQNLAAQRERQAGEDDATYHGRMAGMNLVVNGFKALVEEGSEFSFDWGVDRKAGELSIGMAVSGRAGTDMERTLKTFGARRSMFQSSAADAPVSARMSIPLPKEFSDVLAESFDNGSKQALEKAPDAKSKELAVKLLEAMRPVITADSFDMGIDLIGPSKDENGPRGVVVAGLKVPNGKQIESTLRSIINEAPKDEKVEATFDFAKAADGTPIHKIVLPEEDTQLAKLFGKSVLLVAIRDDAVVFSFGESGQPAIEKALAHLRSTQAAAASAPVSVTIKAGRLMEIAKQMHPEVGKVADQILKDTDAGKDAIRLTLGAPEGVLRLRFTAGMNAIKALFYLGVQASGAAAAAP